MVLLRIKKYLAFTLAEVLITLGIIGVVASLTIPSLIERYQKVTVVTQLQKFYSSMSQAIKLSEADNGPADGWTYGAATSADDTETWFKTYVAPYYKYTSMKKGSEGLAVYLADGTSLYFVKYGVYMHITISFKSATEKYGRNNFIFLIPTYYSYNNYSTNHVYKFGPYDYNISTPFTRTSWINDTDYGCNDTSTSSRAHCAGLIMYDGWKIPDDYPWNL